MRREPHTTEISRAEAERITRAGEMLDAMEIRPASREQGEAWRRIDRDWGAETHPLQGISFDRATADGFPCLEDFE